MRIVGSSPFWVYPIKLIPVTPGLFAKVDDEDYPSLRGYAWYRAGTGRVSYAARKAGNGYQAGSGNDSRVKGYRRGRRSQSMHREIIGAMPGQVVDHIDDDGLNNQRANLRLCTHAQNLQNSRRYRGSVSPYKGVQCLSGRWRARIRHNGAQKHLGCFDTPEQAASAYNAAAIQFYGEFARLNAV